MPDSIVEAGEGGTPRRILDSHLARGAAWTAVSKWSVQGISWASMLILARLLSPSDYGLVGMAGVYLGLIGMVSEFGLGSAVVTLRELTDRDIRQLHTFSLLLGVAAFVISVGIAKPLSLFFKSPQLAALVVVMSLGFIPAGLRTVPTAVLQRDMEFRRLSVAEAVQAVLQAVGAVALAWFGFGYWSLAVSGLAGGVVLTGIVFALRPYGTVWPRLSSIRPALTFGSHMLISRLAWYAYSNADFLVAGRMLGPTALGYYTFAWNLASIPVEKISNIVTRVTPSIFSAVRTDNTELRRYLVKLTDVLSFVTFPAAFGLAAVAPDLVVVVLGAKWADAALPLRLLAFYVSVRSISTILPQILVAKGDTRFVMWSSVFSAVLMPAAFIAGAQWGIGGIAWAWILAHPIVFAIYLKRTWSQIQMNTRQYLDCLAAPLAASVLMVAVVVLIQRATGGALAPAAGLTVQALAGAAVYGLIFLTVYRKRLLRYREEIAAIR